MTTRKLQAVLFLIITGLTLASCSKDDDNGTDDPSNVTKRLIAIDFTSDNNENGSFKIEYSNNKVSKIVDTYKRIGYNGYIGVWTSVFSYSKDGVKEVLEVYNSYGENWLKETNYIFGDNGYVSKGEEKTGSVWSYDYSGDYLTSVRLESLGNILVDDKYNFNDQGLMTNNHFYDKEIRYTNTPNKSGLFLAFSGDIIGEDYIRLQYASLLGKPTSYLPKEAIRVFEISTYNYEIDKDGYVTKAIVKQEYADGGDVTTELYYTYETIE